MQTGDGGAIVAVGEMGPEAPWAVPALEALARSRDPDIRLLAVQALGQIGPPAREAEATLQLRARYQEVRSGGRLQ
jgi:HEAT repeat protein